MSPGGRLRIALRGLKARTDGRFYQCQGCGQLWIRKDKDGKGALCHPCWHAYLPRLSAWRIGGRVGASPELPRQRGRRISPENLLARVILVLEQALGQLQNQSIGLNYTELSTTRRLMGESQHQWFQQVCSSLASLADTR